MERIGEHGGGQACPNGKRLPSVDLEGQLPPGVPCAWSWEGHTNPRPFQGVLPKSRILRAGRGCVIPKAPRMTCHTLYVGLGASLVAPFQGAGGWRRNHTQGCACGLTLGYRYVAPSGQPEACEETKPTSVPGSNNPKPQVPIPMPQSPHIPEADGQAQPCNGGLPTSLKRMDKRNPAMGVSRHP